MTSLRRYKLSKVASDTLSTGAGVAALKSNSGNSITIIAGDCNTSSGVVSNMRTSIKRMPLSISPKLTRSYSPTANLEKPYLIASFAHADIIDGVAPEVQHANEKRKGQEYMNLTCGNVTDMELGCVYGAGSRSAYVIRCINQSTTQPPSKLISGITAKVGRHAAAKKQAVDDVSRRMRLLVQGSRTSWELLLDTKRTSRA
ncbi:hypothetical protein GEV33_014227 [Tenebrio molitor]|uniref:Uncharacterized protein n=1 Tax=Tenebrio molitor TaxID=7067 RepID=A0A8J6H5N1_TENMO|nr:hypothetical protein GEV33_014227 [Tenebrio molitor]